MTIAWMRGVAAALSLTFAGTAIHAATITDASFDAAGTYALENGALGFDGSFSAALLGDPTVARDYDLGIKISLLGDVVFQQTLSLGTFRIADVANDVFSSPYFGDVVSYLSSITSNVSFGPNSVSGDFSFDLDQGQTNDFVNVVCASIFAGTQCSAPASGNFAIALALGYDAPDAAPVPLPAGLPLLGAGLACLAGIRRLRRS